MADATYVQPAFTGGEISKLAQGRIDRPDYRTLMNVCLNGLPVETGGWVRRPGTRCLAVTRGGQAARIASFDFKATQPYTIEFTDATLRFLTGTQVVTTNDAQGVASINAANPAEVQTNTNHAWSTGDTVYFGSLGANAPLLHNRPFKLTVTAANKFTLVDAVTNATLDGATVAVVPGTTVSRVLELASPYVGGAWATLRVIKADIPVASAGTTPGAVLLQASVKPYVLQVATAPTGSASATFTMTPAVFKDGPYFDPLQGGVLATPSGLSGIISLTLSFNSYDLAKAYSLGDYSTFGGINYKSLADANLNHQPDISPTFWTPVAASDPVGPSGFTGADVGRHVRLYSEPAVWAAATSYAKDAVVAYGGSGLAYTGATYWRSLVAANLGNVPGVDITKWALFPTGAIWSWGKITALLNEIDRALAGSVAFGDMTTGGGLAAAFDGNTSQAAAACARKTANFGPFFGPFSMSAYVGRDYSAAADQPIAQGTYYPATDRGISPAGVSPPSVITSTSLVINLRGKAAVPVNAADGTLLGTTGEIGNTTTPVTILSSDQVTAWKYVWFEVLHTWEVAAFESDLYEIDCGEAKFFNPPSTTTANGAQVQILGDPLLYLTPVRTWRLGVYSDTVGWPTCGTSHEGRLWLSGVVGNRIDASKSNDIFNFAPTAPDGTVTAASAISYTFNAPDVNTILWMDPDQIGIVCGTAAGEWLVQASALNQPLTPNSIQAHRAMRHKCANIEPRRTGLTLCAVQAGKRSVLEFFADVYSGKFGADNLAEDAKHITKGNVAELAFTAEITPVIWMRKEDGTLAGATYRRKTLSSAQRAEIRGWHRHTLGSGRSVEYISAGPSPGGALDALSLVTNDDTGLRHVEAMTDILDEGSLLSQASYLDGAIVPSATAPAAPTPSMPYGGLTLYGLWPLNGETVTAWLGGLDCGDHVVANGTITVPFGDGVSAGTGGGMFTLAFTTSGDANGVTMFTGGSMPMVVGFSYESDGQIVRPQTPQESGARNGPALGKKRRNHQYALQLEGTQGVSVGTEFTTARLNAALLKTRGGRTLKPHEQFSGIHRDAVIDEDSYDGMICWRVSRPYIVNIAALSGFIETKDS